MALYEYRCQVCDCDIEIKQGILEDSKKMLYCPYCERMRPVKKVMSRCNFILKGGAWAKDGYVRNEK